MNRLYVCIDCCVCAVELSCVVGVRCSVRSSCHPHHVLFEKYATINGDNGSALMNVWNGFRVDRKRTAHCTFVLAAACALDLIYLKLLLLAFNAISMRS